MYLDLCILFIFVTVLLECSYIFYLCFWCLWRWLKDLGSLGNRLMYGFRVAYEIWASNSCFWQNNRSSQWSHFSSICHFKFKVPILVVILIILPTTILIPIYHFLSYFTFYKSISWRHKLFFKKIHDILFILCLHINKRQVQLSLCFLFIWQIFDMNTP